MLRAGLLAMLATVIYGQTAVTILEKKCAGCHSGAAAKGGLDVTSRESLLRGGGRGAAITPSQAQSSLLYKAITHQAAAWVYWPPFSRSPGG